MSTPVTISICDITVAGDSLSKLFLQSLCYCERHGTASWLI